MVCGADGSTAERRKQWPSFAVQETTALGKTLVFSLLDPGNKSFLLTISDVVVSFGSTSTKRPTSFRVTFTPLPQEFSLVNKHINNYRAMLEVL